MPAFDYYQEEAVVKLIEGDWKWQDHFTLGKQLEKIAANLITKQKERYARNHGITVDESTEDGILKSDVGGLKDSPGTCDASAQWYSELFCIFA